MLKHAVDVLKSDKGKKFCAYSISFLMSVLIFWFFTFDFNMSLTDVLRYGLTLYTVAIIGIWWLLSKLHNSIFKFRFNVFETILQLILACFFSIASVMGKYFEVSFIEGAENDVISFLKKGMMLFAVCGGILFFFLVIRIIWRLYLSNIHIKNDENSFLDKFFNINLYKHCIVVLVICWLPQYIIRFPGVFTFDNWHSLAMYLGHQEMTTQHPMVWNVLIGKLTDFGMLIGINWFAMLCITLIHHICAILIIPYTISTIKKMGGSNGLLAIVFAFFVILPPMYIYASTVYNDFLFGLAFLLLTIELVYYLYDRKEYFSSKHLLLTALAIIGTFLRYNGIYAITLTFAVVIAREFCHLIKTKKKGNWVSLAFLSMVFIIPIVGGMFAQSFLNASYNAKSITSRAILAMPIQQTVRCLKEHGNQIPEEEYQAIHTVLTWTDEQYSEEYFARNFDSVKESFKTDATRQEMISFLKAWIKLVKLYPKTCFMATAEQTYYLFCPFIKNTRYYISTLSCSVLIEPRTGMVPSPYIFTVPVLEKLCSILNIVLTSIYPCIPILGLTVSQGMYTLLLIVISVALLFRKDRRALILTIPMYAILCITFLGPAVYNHPRYTYPIMYCMPVLIFVYMLSRPREENLYEQ